MRNVEREFTNPENICQEASDFFNEFYSTGNFTDRMKIFCGFIDAYKNQPEIMETVIKKVDPKFNNFYSLFGTDGCRSVCYRENILLDRLRECCLEKKLKNRVIETF